MLLIPSCLGFPETTSTSRRALHSGYTTSTFYTQSVPFLVFLMLLDNVSDRSSRHGFLVLCLLLQYTLSLLEEPQPHLPHGLLLGIHPPGCGRSDHRLCRCESRVRICLLTLSRPSDTHPWRGHQVRPWGTPALHQPPLDQH